MSGHVGSCWVKLYVLRPIGVDRVQFYSVWFYPFKLILYYTVQCGAVQCSTVRYSSCKVRDVVLNIFGCSTMLWVDCFDNSDAYSDTV